MKKYNSNVNATSFKKNKVIQNFTGNVFSEIKVGQEILAQYKKKSATIGKVTQKSKNCIFVKINNSINCITKADLTTQEIKIYPATRGGRK